MRQAGRYLPEYRALRAKSGTFLDLCLDPVKAAEVTLQPIRRFGFDAAIVFSDILVVPYAMGRSVAFVAGEGPKLEPIDTAGIDALEMGTVNDRLEPLYETLGRVRGSLPDETALIGFVGAPWTIATYMVAGHGTPDQKPARLLAATDPKSFQTLIDRLSDALVESLVGQLKAGADVVKIFDSWAGILNEADFKRWCIAPTASIVRRVREQIPRARIIGFPKGAGYRLERYCRETGVDGVGIDWTVPLYVARERLQPMTAVEGNLDPLVLVAGGGQLDHEIDIIISDLGSGRFIFNLGHGVVPETPLDHVARLVERVRSREKPTL